MAKDQRNVEAITPMEEDFAKWYTDICLKAELVDYASVKGFLILRPYGYAIWENIQKYMDAEFKKTGHVNVAMPVLIPESLLKKEGELVAGFAPEVAWVTHGGSEQLEERLAFRPTSETMFCDHWSHVLHSYRELPMLYNQWCSVIRWEKTTRPFLRSREFWWQEGHTIHETAAEAEAETEQQLNCYADVCKNALAMPVVKGRKTDKEKFAGAEATYTIECMMKDHKALQSGTSHFFGDKFSRAYDVTFTGRDNTLQYPFQTSWGASTRLIGAIIMTHSDNHGLVLPPVIAPTQVVVIPIAQHKEGVLEAAAASARPSDRRRYPRQHGRQRPVRRLEVRPVRDEGRAPACGDRPQGHGEGPVLHRPPRHRRKDLRAPDGAGERRAAAAAGRPRQPVRHGGEEPGGQHLRYDLLGGGQGDGPGQGRLRPYQVVRQPGVRAGHEGEGRRVQPLYAAEAVRHHRQVRGVRQGMHHRHLLGRGVLRRIKKEQSKGRLTQENTRFCLCLSG